MHQYKIGAPFERNIIRTLSGGPEGKLILSDGLWLLHQSMKIDAFLNQEASMVADVLGATL
jgi:hypothetical protein